jgi:hypothetical protein
VQSIVHDIIHTNVYKQQVVVLQQTIEDSRHKMQELTLHIEDMYSQYVGDIALYNKCIRELERDYQKLAGLAGCGASFADDEKENIRGQRAAIFKANNTVHNTTAAGGWQEDHCIGKRIDNLADVCN